MPEAWDQRGTWEGGLVPARISGEDVCAGYAGGARLPVISQISVVKIERTRDSVYGIC